MNDNLDKEPTFLNSSRETSPSPFQSNIRNAMSICLVGAKSIENQNENAYYGNVHLRMLGTDLKAASKTL